MNIINTPPFQEFADAFLHYDEGATVRIATEEGTAEWVQISRMKWTGGKITLLGYVPDDAESPYRRIDIVSYGCSSVSTSLSDRITKISRSAINGSDTL